MDNLLIVDVPEGAYNPWMMECHAYEGQSKLGYYVKGKSFDGMAWSESIELPPGSWTIVEQTEEGAAKIMPSKPHEDQLFYTHDNTPETFETAIDALHSWIRSMGKEPKTSIILKKEI
jgi:hypothetical protein